MWQKPKTKKQLILEAIAANPGIDVYQLTALTGCKRSYASEVITYLAMEGIVSKRKQKKRVIAYSRIVSLRQELEPPLKRIVIPPSQLSASTATLPFKELAALQTFKAKSG